MKLSLTQRAYIAGLLDADGSIYVRAKPNPTYRFGYQIAPYIVFYQSSKSNVFKNMYSILPFGKVRIRNDGVTEFIVSKRDDLVEFVQIIEPFLILKQKQITLLKKILKAKELVQDEKDFEKILQLCNEFQNLNYSKKRKIRTLIPVETEC